MECTCTIETGSDYEYDEALSQKMITARKTHKCCECGRDIRPGEKYEFYVGVFDGSFYKHKTCLDCLLFRETFFNDWCFESLWEEFTGQMDDCGWQVPEKCLSKVTPATRARICEMIERHWEDGE